jgi:hypothetical protein
VTDQLTPVERVLDRLEDYTERRGEFRARCPVHQGKSDDSLSIKEGEDGRALLICRADCGFEDIVHALGLQVVDLFAHNGRPGPKAKKANGKPKREERSLTTNELPDGTYWEFTSPAGEVLYIQRHKREYYQKVGDQWKQGLEGVSQVLYRLPELIDGVRAGKTIYHLEGPKDVETACERLGVVATTSGPTSSWRSEFRVHYIGADVVILPDNDEPGYKYAEKVAHDLRQVARSVKVVHLPDLPESGDLTDWLDSGHTREDFFEMVEVAPAYDPEKKLSDEPFTPFTLFTPNLRAENVAPFPVEALPRPVARLVREAADAIGCPPDGIALAALATLGSAIGNSRVIQLKKGWTEGASIYAALLAESGEKKTAALGVATDVSQQLDNRLRKEHEQALDEFAREEREYDLEKKEAAKAGIAAPPPPRPPVAERAHVNDTTVEALIPILKHNPRGILLERDELVGWVKAMDQYKAGGKGSDRQFWLSAWSNRPVSVDRKGQQEPIGVLRPFVSVIGSIQPDILPELAENREDGMLERFLFAYPVALNSRWTEDEISEGALTAYRALYDNLRQMAMENDDLGDPVEVPVGFSSEAKQLFVNQYNVHRTEMGMPGFPKNLRSPWAKLEGYFARLILIIASCRCVQNGACERIEEEDVLRAWMLIEYFKAQSRRVFGVLRGFDPVEKLVEEVAWFLYDQGGAWAGKPEDFHAALPSDFKHERADDLSKWLKNRAETHREFEYAVRHRAAKKDDGSPTTARHLTLTLRNGVNGVNGVNGAKGR